MYNIITINDVELPFDATDVDCIESIQNAQEHLSGTLSPLPDGANYIETVKHECAYIKGFFDFVFGLGTAEKLFCGRNSLAGCMDAMRQFDAQVKAQQQNAASGMNAYQPVNRAQKRAVKSAKKK